MADYNQQGTSISFGNVPIREPIKMDLSVFAKALDTLDAKHKEALEKKSQIKTALANADLHESEDAWKQNYIKSIDDILSNRYGDLSSRLDKAISLAGDVASDPALLGRARSNKVYQEKLKEVESRNDISQITKDRWIEENQYSYEDKFDSNGNLVGGTIWKANWNPVKHKDYTEAMRQALQIVGISDITTGSDRKTTTGTLTGVTSSSKGGQHKYSELTKKKAREAVQSIVDADPELRASLDQDYRDEIWSAEKMYDEIEKLEDSLAFMSIDNPDYKKTKTLINRRNSELKLLYSKILDTSESTNGLTFKGLDDYYNKVLLPTIDVSARVSRTDISNREDYSDVRDNTSSTGSRSGNGGQTDTSTVVGNGMYVNGDGSGNEQPNKQSNYQGKAFDFISFRGAVTVGS